MVKKLKWSYVGHIARREEGRREKKVLNGPPENGTGGRVDPSQDGRMKSNPTVVPLGVEILRSAIGGKKSGRLMLSKERINCS